MGGFGRTIDDKRIGIASPTGLTTLSDRLMQEADLPNAGDPRKLYSRLWGSLLLILHAAGRANRPLSDYPSPRPEALYTQSQAAGSLRGNFQLIRHPGHRVADRVAT
jgi:hypothetical protein